MRSFALAFLCSLLLAAPAAAKRPDLVIGSGSAKVSGGTVSGTFVVRNKGGRKAGKSVGAVFMGDAEAARVSVKRLASGQRRKAGFSETVPDGLGPGTYTVKACADADDVVVERREHNNCRALGDVHVSGSGSGSTPSGPVPYEKEQPFQLDSGKSTYWTDIPAGYDDSHGTPTPLLVWMHGCGGESQGDIYTVAPTGGRTYIAISIGGRDGDCWNVDQDSEKVLAAIANVGTHFNVDRRRVVIAGYSSGGDLAYRTAFYNSSAFAGVLAVNTSPFRDTGSSQKDSIAAATNRFHVVHLAHTGDEEYPIDGVRKETDALKEAGFPIQRVERAGAHYDDNTDSDIQTVLLPHMTDGWTSP